MHIKNFFILTILIGFNNLLVIKASEAQLNIENQYLYVDGDMWDECVASPQPFLELAATEGSEWNHIIQFSKGKDLFCMGIPQKALFIINVSHLLLKLEEIKSAAAKNDPKNIIKNVTQMLNSKDSKKNKSYTYVTIYLIPILLQDTDFLAFTLKQKESLLSEHMLESTRRYQNIKKQNSKTQTLLLNKQGERPKSFQKEELTKKDQKIKQHSIYLYLMVFALLTMTIGYINK